MGDTSAYTNEIGRALEISGQKIANQDIKDLVKEYVDAKGCTPTQVQTEKIVDKITRSEIEIWSEHHKREPSKYPWTSFLFGDRHKQNVTRYVDLKFGK